MTANDWSRVWPVFRGPASVVLDDMSITRGEVVGVRNDVMRLRIDGTESWHHWSRIWPARCRYEEEVRCG